MVAVIRNVRADLSGGLDHVRSGLGHHFLPVNGAGHETRVLRRRGLGRTRRWWRRLRPGGARRIGGRAGDRLSLAFQRPFVAALAHCSTSPPIILIESKVGIRSASRRPSTIRAMPERIAKEGART